MTIFKLFALILITTSIFYTTIEIKAIGPNLISNLSFEEGSSGWTQNKWGDNNANFTIENNGQDGFKSGKVEMTSYNSGDARWSYSPVNVAPNTEYETGFFYKSNVNSYVLMDIVNSAGSHDACTMPRSCQ